MKGLSVLFTVLLLVLANELAARLKRAGALPSGNTRDGSATVSLPAPSATRASSVSHSL
jgi:hypothetical protein